MTQCKVITLQTDIKLRLLSMENISTTVTKYLRASYNAQFIWSCNGSMETGWDLCCVVLCSPLASIFTFFFWNQLCTQSCGVLFFVRPTNISQEVMASKPSRVVVETLWGHLTSFTLLWLLTLLERLHRPSTTSNALSFTLSHHISLILLPVLHINLTLHHHYQIYQHFHIMWIRTR